MLKLSRSGRPASGPEIGKSVTPTDSFGSGSSPAARADDLAASISRSAAWREGAERDARARASAKVSGAAAAVPPQGHAQAQQAAARRGLNMGRPERMSMGSRQRTGGLRASASRAGARSQAVVRGGGVSERTSTPGAKRSRTAEKRTVFQAASDVGATLGSAHTAWQAIAHAAAHTLSFGQQGASVVSDGEPMPSIVTVPARSISQPGAAAEATTGLRASARAAKKARRRVTGGDLSVCASRRHARGLLWTVPDKRSGLLKKAF